MLVPESFCLLGGVDNRLDDLQFSLLVECRQSREFLGHWGFVQSQEGRQSCAGLDHLGEVRRAAGLPFRRRGLGVAAPVVARSLDLHGVPQRPIPARERFILDGFQLGGLLGLPEVLRDVDLGKFGLAFLREPPGDGLVSNAQSGRNGF